MAKFRVENPYYSNGNKVIDWNKDFPMNNTNLRIDTWKAKVIWNPAGEDIVIGRVYYKHTGTPESVIKFNQTLFNNYVLSPEDLLNLAALTVKHHKDALTPISKTPASAIAA